MASFSNIGEEVSLNEINNIKVNAIFKEYREAIDLAKMVINNLSSNISQGDNSNYTLPFWIDIALLFETYTYSLLLEKNPSTKTQVSGNYGHVDFIIDDTIIDTKYKHHYRGGNFDGYDYNIDDIRQLSGYSRDKKILKKLNVIDNEPKCLIIYPNKSGDSKLSKNVFEKAEKIEQFTSFYKLGIKLPCL